MKINQLHMKEGKGEILIYETADGGPQIEVTLEEETLWLSQALMAELFGKDFRTIAKHIKNIYAVALTLMIAESKPDEKEMMTKVVVNLINLKN
jgi:hypothetical protein